MNNRFLATFLIASSIILSVQKNTLAEISKLSLIAQSNQSMNEIFDGTDRAIKFIEAPFTVQGGSDAGKIGRDSKLCDDSSTCKDVNSKERNVNFKLISFGNQTSQTSKTWVVIHGWNDNSKDGGDLQNLARTIANKNPNDRVLMLDWSEASNNNGEAGIGDINRGNYYAATWIRPIAEKAVEKLRELGISDSEASQGLNLVGHSLGSIMSAEIGAVYKESQRKNQFIKNEDKIGVNSINALDPASEINTLMDLGGYDVDGRSPAYILEDRVVTDVDENGFPLLDLSSGKVTTKVIKDRVMQPKENIDKPSSFRDSARFSRAFVGENSLAGNQTLAATANESFQMYFGDFKDFGGILDFGGEHSRVVKAFTNMIVSDPFSGYWGINDLNTHANISSNSYNYGHEGILSVDSKNNIQDITLTHKIKGSVKIDRDGLAFQPKLGDRNPIVGGLLDFIGGVVNGISAGEIGTATELFPADTSNIAQSILSFNSCTTQVGSSHIGSASCSFRTPNQPVQDEVITQFQENQGINTSIQEANQYTNGQIVRAPLDIGLTWNQSTNLDLDSHLVTPSEQHIYYSEPGALNAAPNAFLYRDSIPPGRVGAEQTRIDVFQAGIYHFYVHNFSDYTNSPAAQAAGPAGLANANAEVRLYEGGSPLTNIPNDPNTFDLNNPNVQRVGNPYPGDSTFVTSLGQQGNTWYVFRLDTRTGILTRVNQYGNVASPATVPQFNPTQR
jgi:pimeloyl-ACP methyl ester carboxylesterase